MRKRYPRQQTFFSPSAGGGRFLFIRAKNDMIPLQHRKHRIQTFLVNTLFFHSLTLNRLFSSFTT